MTTGRKTLGISQAGYDALVEDLDDALRRDDTDLSRCDVRIQGSAARFFAGRHKAMPKNRDDLIDEFVELRNRYPEPWEIDDAMARLSAWLSGDAGPSQRPFDVLYRLGIAAERSDIDLQISSDEMRDRVHQWLIANGQDPTEARTKNPAYGFYKKPIVDRVFPSLYLFRMRMSDAVRRHISVALFPSGGPPNVTLAPHGLSSHFDDHDWIVRRAGGSA